MIKRLAVILFTLSLTPTAFAAITPFTTLLQAEQACPSIAGLTFVPSSPNLPTSAGRITGYNHLTFENLTPKPAIHPKTMNSNGLILDAQFRNNGGMYGYQSGNTVTCFYSYTGFTGVTVALAMRSQ